MVDERDLPARFWGRSEDIDGTGKSTGGNGDIRINDPEDIVLRLPIRAYEVIDLWICSNDFLTFPKCRSMIPEETRKG